MQALEEAIERGLERVEAGAQGEHKIQRGYLPRLTYSSHYICNPLLRERIEGSLHRLASACSVLTVCCRALQRCCRALCTLSAKLLLVDD